MNPFGIQTERFLIATNNKNERVGMAQLRPLGPVQSSWNFNQKQVNEELWADLESDPTLFPNGWASLPWTREYRDYAKMADKKRKQRETMESLEEKRQLWELASVFVDDAYRRQGIGASLVQGLLDRLVRFYGTQSLENVYLLTLANKVTWYEQFGFEVVLSEDIPKEMELEVAAGNLITKMMGERLCCMRGKSKL
jgi:N-acetylglutamate synthase-like GNAT family acetyltransferase